MARASIVFIVIFWAHILPGQRTDDSPYSVEINDHKEGYGFIDSLLGSKKVVLLGELDHGDGSSFVVKTDLIKYLHEQHHFNLLIFEASFINCDILWNTMGGNTQFKDEVKKNIYPIWSEVEETIELFQYIEDQYLKGTPLRMVGMDPQFSGSNNAHEFIELLKQTLPSAMTGSKLFAQFVHDMKNMSVWMEFPKKEEQELSEEEFTLYCDTILEVIKQNKKDTINLSLWEMYMNNIKIMGQIKRVRDNRSFERRDEQMFNNLKYWLSKNENDKSIIWAANAHIIRKDKVLEKRGKKHYLLGLKKLGDYIHDAYHDSIYSIAMVSGKGSTIDFTNPSKKNRIKIPKGTSMEGIMQGKRTCLVDLKSFENAYNLKNYKSQLFYTNIACSGQWSQHFDGFIYIPEMIPSTPLWLKNRK